MNSLVKLLCLPVYFFLNTLNFSCNFSLFYFCYESCKHIFDNQVHFLVLTFFHFFPSLLFVFNSTLILRKSLTLLQFHWIGSIVWSQWVLEKGYCCHIPSIYREELAFLSDVLVSFSSKTQNKWQHKDNGNKDNEKKAFDNNSNNKAKDNEDEDNNKLTKLGRYEWTKLNCQELNC